MYFLIFQPEDMLELCLSFNDSQPICTYKRYAYKKRIWINRSQDAPTAEPIQTSYMENFLLKLANRFYQPTFLFINSYLKNFFKGITLVII